MKIVAYYAGYLLLPLLFVIHLSKSLYRSTKIGIHNAVVQTHSDMLSHKRCYDRD